MSISSRGFTAGTMKLSTLSKRMKVLVSFTASIAYQLCQPVDRFGTIHISTYVNIKFDIYTLYKLRYRITTKMYHKPRRYLRDVSSGFSRGWSDIASKDIAQWFQTA